MVVKWKRTSGEEKPVSVGSLLFSININRTQMFPHRFDSVESSSRSEQVQSESNSSMARCRASKPAESPSRVKERFQPYSEFDRRLTSV